MAGNCPQYFRIFQEKDPRPSILVYCLYNAESSCLLKHNSGWMASGLCPQLTLHIYLRCQEEGPAWGTNGEEIPSHDPFSSQSSSPRSRVMQWVSHSDSMTYLTSPPFLTCLSAHLYPPHTSPSFTFKWASANTVRESFCSCSPSRYKRGWVMCAICSFYLQVCMKNVSGKFWADGSESYGFFTNFGKYSIPFFVFWQELCISYTSL